MGVSMMLIGHDMGLQAQLVDRIAVMYAGHMVEVSPVETIFAEPLHPYTQLLIESIPSIKERKPLKLTEGITHDLRNPPPGCIFQERCPKVMEVCRVDRPCRARFGRALRGVSLVRIARNTKQDFFMSEPLLDIKNATKVYGGTGFFSGAHHRRLARFQPDHRRPSRRRSPPLPAKAAAARRRSPIWCSASSRSPVGQVAL
jgi:oligopeptide/dipeptide ABC transporter ATP-binding protein